MSVRLEQLELEASGVHDEVVCVLQKYFGLDRAGCQYDESDIWNVVISASVERMSIEGVCDVMSDAPSPNVVRNAIRGVLPDEAEIEELETTLNQALQGELPAKLLNRQLKCAIDVVLIPYHGKHEVDDEAIRRGKAKSGTTHFHAYATLYTVRHNQRYTLGIVLVKQSDTALDILKRLHQKAKRLKVKIKRLLLDREFDNNGVVAYLKEQSFPAIIPMVLRGKDKNSGSKKLTKTHKSYRTTYTRQSKIYGTQELSVYIACKYSKGRYKRKGRVCFAYIVTGALKMHPLQIFQEYRSRFAIEASYRLMNKIRAKTTSKSPLLRLFYTGLAFLFLNIWNGIKWKTLFIPHRPGPRTVLHSWLRLDLFRLWLFEIAKSQLGGLRLVISVHCFP